MVTTTKRLEPVMYKARKTQCHSLVYDKLDIPSASVITACPPRPVHRMCSPQNQYQMTYPAPSFDIDHLCRPHRLYCTFDAQSVLSLSTSFPSPCRRLKAETLSRAKCASSCDHAKIKNRERACYSASTYNIYLKHSKPSQSF